jgi:hypothetical protein
MARRAPRSLRWLALAVLAVVLAACSSNPATTSSSTSTSTTGSAAPAPITYPHNWTIGSVDASGATWTTNVAIADPISGHTLTAYTSLYGNPCSLDPTTDAIVPFQITTTGTPYGLLTSSGDQELKVVNAALGGASGTQSQAGLAAGELLKAAESSSGGPTCSSLDPPRETMTLGGASLTYGQKVVLNGYFDLKHWAEPGSKHGDASWVPNIWILVPNSGSRPAGKGYETTSVNGPGLVSLLDYTPTTTYDPSVSSDKKNVGYGWAFPIDGKSQPDCGNASSTSPSGPSMPSLQALCIALPAEVVVQYLNDHAEITDATARSLTGVTSEDSMKAVFNSLRKNGEIEMVPGKSDTWRKKESL